MLWSWTNRRNRTFVFTSWIWRWQNEKWSDEHWEKKNGMNWEKKTKTDSAEKCSTLSNEELNNVILRPNANKISPWRKRKTSNWSSPDSPDRCWERERRILLSVWWWRHRECKEERSRASIVPQHCEKESQTCHLHGHREHFHSLPDEQYNWRKKKDLFPRHRTLDPNDIWHWSFFSPCHRSVLAISIGRYFDCREHRRSLADRIDAFVEEEDDDLRETDRNNRSCTLCLHGHPNESKVRNNCVAKKESPPVLLSSLLLLPLHWSQIPPTNLLRTRKDERSLQFSPKDTNVGRRDLTQAGAAEWFLGGGAQVTLSIFGGAQSTFSWVFAGRKRSVRRIFQKLGGLKPPQPPRFRRLWTQGDETSSKWHFGGWNGHKHWSLLISSTSLDDFHFWLNSGMMLTKSKDIDVFLRFILRNDRLEANTTKQTFS